MRAYCRRSRGSDLHGFDRSVREGPADAGISPANHCLTGDLACDRCTLGPTGRRQTTSTCSGQHAVREVRWLNSPIWRQGCDPWYPAALVGGVAEPEGDPADVFDDSVVALAAGVGQPGVDGGDDRLLPSVDGRCQGVDPGDLAGGGEGLEGVQSSCGLVAERSVILAPHHLPLQHFGDPGGGQIRSRSRSCRAWRTSCGAARR